MPKPSSGYETFTLAMDWDGSAWTPVPTPSPAPYPGGTDARLHAVDAVASDDVWAGALYAMERVGACDMWAVGRHANHGLVPFAARLQSATWVASARGWQALRASRRSSAPTR